MERTDSSLSGATRLIQWFINIFDFSDSLKDTSVSESVSKETPSLKDQKSERKVRAGAAQ